MIKSKITLFVVLACLSSCTENSSRDGQSITPAQNAQSKDSISVAVSERIDFSNLEQYYTADSVFSFVAPAGFFRVSGNALQSKDVDFGMTTKTYDQFYPCDPEEEILTIKSIQTENMKGIKVSYKTLKPSFFVISGVDDQDRIIYVKGDYAEMLSMQGREEGEPSIIWRKAGVIRFSYPQEKKTDFNRVIEIISNSLRVNHDLF
jgi:hypothetical protein